MPHIHTQPGQYDHTVSIYLFRIDFDEPKVMLHMHRKIGMYAQFGGHIELNETPWSAAAHELREETGYDMSQLQVLQPKNRVKAIRGAILHPYSVAHATMGYPNNTDHFHTDSAYAIITGQEPNGAPEEGESTSIRLFTRAEVISLGEDHIDRVTRDVALYVFDEIFNHWEPVSPNEFK